MCRVHGRGNRVRSGGHDTAQHGQPQGQPAWPGPHSFGQGKRAPLRPKAHPSWSLKTALGPKQTSFLGTSPQATPLLGLSSFWFVPTFKDDVQAVCGERAR